MLDSTTAPKWSHAKKYFCKLSSLNMDDSSEDQDCSLKDIYILPKLKKLKTDSQYACNKKTRQLLIWAGKNPLPLRHLP
jgi:hypothetical protein